MINSDNVFNNNKKNDNKHNDNKNKKNKKSKYEFYEKQKLLKKKIIIKKIVNKKYSIPLVLYQTYNNDKAHKYKIMKLQWNKIDWLKRKFFNDYDIEIFINNNAPLFINFFNSLITLKERAYFFKYLLLYYEGGVYSNMNIMLKNNINLLELFNYPLVLIYDKIKYDISNNKINNNKINNNKINNNKINNNKIKSGYRKIIKDNIIFCTKNHPLIYKFILFIVNNYNKNNTLEINFGFKILSYFIKKNCNKYNIKYINYHNLVDNDSIKKFIKIKK